MTVHAFVSVRLRSEIIHWDRVCRGGFYTREASLGFIQGRPVLVFLEFGSPFVTLVLFNM